jgi:hypothetical protein
LNASRATSIGKVPLKWPPTEAALSLLEFPMSLDAYHTVLTQHGKVTITEKGIEVEGFEGLNTSCRDVAVLACAGAIGELQREMMRNIERPGGGNIVISG